MSERTHDHDHESRGLLGRLRDIVFHDHDHGESPVPADTSGQGIRATKISLAGLGVTAVLQGVLVLFTGSVALLSDTLHNLTDALTAIPLWIAFSLGRRQPTRRFTHGYYRAEDLAGIVIVLAIAVSAGAVVWESVQRLFDPRDLENIGWVIAAGVIGALGNEWVARYRIRVGRRIGSEALVADGYHARTDAYTSLSVVVAGVGAALGWQWADPVAGLLVAAMILVILRRTAISMFGRLLDAVDPDLVEQATAIANAVGGVRSVADVRLRFAGHRLLATVTIEVDPEMSVRMGHDVGERVAHELAHELPYALDAVIHVDPAGLVGSHDLTDHHRARMEGRDPADHD